MDAPLGLLSLPDVKLLPTVMVACTVDGVRAIARGRRDVREFIHNTIVDVIHTTLLQVWTRVRVRAAAGPHLTKLSPSPQGRVGASTFGELVPRPLGSWCRDLWGVGALTSGELVPRPQGGVGATLPHSRALLPLLLFAAPDAYRCRRFRCSDVSCR
eukprot:363094-Chlamydomonas_euryale.AAC.2